ncbi:hypothetical protein MTO96_010004 [Rhipicephalus appendiculatus]
MLWFRVRGGTKAEADEMISVTYWTCPLNSVDERVPGRRHRLQNARLIATLRRSAVRPWSSTAQGHCLCQPEPPPAFRSRHW